MSPQVSLTMFPSTYFYVSFGISQMLDGKAKTRIHSKSAHKKCMHFLSDKAKH